MAAQRGGKRAGAGRKPKPTSPAEVTKQALSQELAQKILDFVAQPANPHDSPATPAPDKQNPKCRCICCRWWRILDSSDVRVRLIAEERLLNRAIGRAPRAPMAPEDKKGKLDPLNSNMRVIVEFIGRDIPDDGPA